MSSANLRERMQERKRQVRALISSSLAEAAQNPLESASPTAKVEFALGATSGEDILPEACSSAAPSLAEVVPSEQASAPPAKKLKRNDTSSTSLASESRRRSWPQKESVEALLGAASVKQKESQKVTDEILDLLNKPTAKELALVEKFRSDGTQMREFCARATRRRCERARGDGRACGKLHFRKIVQKHTDMSLGDCSFLNTCFHMDQCKFIHYEVDYGSQRRPANNTNKQRHSSGSSRNSGGEKNAGGGGGAEGGGKLGAPLSTQVRAVEDEGRLASLLAAPTVLYPPQWLQCDLRFFDLSVVGQCSVVMADPPWDIHMELPYGTMSDDEMRRLNIQCLQQEGIIFLWVTGRAMELGRECLRLWGYRHVDEIIWVKTNQLQRIIRTGRTGHWLNHGKEHCLVGLKGGADRYYTGLDCDVIVAEVRATSHKPDEIYGIIERLSPGTKKVELFGRHHNVQPNWLTVGNQLDGVRLLDPDVVSRFNERYPDGNCLPSAEDVLVYKQQKDSRAPIRAPRR